MSDQPQSVSPVEENGLTKADLMGRFIDSLSKLEALSGGAEYILDPLNAMFDVAKTLVQQVGDRDDLLARAEHLIDSAVAANEELTRQRDHVIGEMMGLINDLKAGDFFSDAIQTPGEIGVKGEIYNAAVEQHNEAFWSSLPYDMANALGEKWQYWDADNLFMLITGDEVETADGLGVDEDDVLAFREKLLAMVRDLTEQGRADE